MSERRPPALRVLGWLLPGEFVRRVAEPAYFDLILERESHDLPRLAVPWFVLSCLRVGGTQVFWRRRRLTRISLMVAGVAGLTLVVLMYALREAYAAPPN